MKGIAQVGLLSVLCVFLGACGVSRWEKVPEVGFYQWVCEEYQKRGVEPGGEDGIEIEVAGAIMIRPEEKGMVYEKYTVTVYVYGEVDDGRRASVIASLRTRAARELRHRAVIKYYAKHEDYRTGREPVSVVKF